MIENIKAWIRSNFFTKSDLHDNGALDSRYYTETEIDASIGTPTITDWTTANHTHQSVAQAGQLDHGLALTGLTDDDHTQYALLAGRSGGQTFKGGTGSGDDFTIMTTNHGTKGTIFMGTSGYDEANNRLGIKTASPTRALQVAGTVYISANDAPFTTSAWGKAIELNADNAIQWLKGGGSISRGIGYSADGTFYIFRSTADDASAAATTDVTIDASGNIAFNARVGTAWTSVTYNTGWVDYDATWNGAQYKKVGDLVFLRGLVKRTSGAETIIFTLPAGFRPPKYVMFPQLSNDALSRIDIYTDGTVNMLLGSATSWVGLSGIVFSIL
jgi:hypothetical protein